MIMMTLKGTVKMTIQKSTRRIPLMQLLKTQEKNQARKQRLVKKLEHHEMFLMMNEYTPCSSVI